MDVPIHIRAAYAALSWPPWYVLLITVVKFSAALYCKLLLCDTIEHTLQSQEVVVTDSRQEA